MFPSSGACRFWHSSCVNTAGIRQTSICESCWKDAGRIARVGGAVTPRNTLPPDGGPRWQTYSARAQAGTQMSGVHQRFLRDGAAQVTSFNLRDSGKRISEAVARSAIHIHKLLRGIVVQVLSQPSFDFGYAHPFAFAIVGDLITTDLAQAEITRFWMDKIKTTHA
jgi:hypothetical protein